MFAPRDQFNIRGKLHVIRFYKWYFCMAENLFLSFGYWSVSKPCWIFPLYFDVNLFKVFLYLTCVGLFGLRITCQKITWIFFPMLEICFDVRRFCYIITLKCLENVKYCSILLFWYLFIFFHKNKSVWRRQRIVSSERK